MSEAIGFGLSVLRLCSESWDLVSKPGPNSDYGKQGTVTLMRDPNQCNHTTVAEHYDGKSTRRGRFVNIPAEEPVS